MSWMKRFFLAALLSLASVSGVSAAQTAATDPDGTVSFYASTTDVTRISVRGDRIRRIVNDASQFEMSNDESTGDVFLRFSGEQAKRESGYIVTEKGVTIGYELRPANRAVEPVLITITGRESQSQSGNGAGADFASGDIGFSDSIAVQMTEIVRGVAAEHIVGRRASGRNNRVFKTVRGEGWKATIRIAAAGAEGRLVREQEFYRAGVQAVWILKSQLAANERTFVVIVEAG